MARRGRPRVQPDRKKIVHYAAKFWTVKDIAEEVGVGERTLFRNFGSELDAGRRKWRGTLRDRLIRQITQGNFNAIKFVACQPEWRGGLGWTEEVTHEHRGSVVVSVAELQQAVTAAQSVPTLDRANGHANGNGNGHAADGLV